MVRSFFLLGVLFATALGSAQADIKATNCEIFVDKVSKEIWQEGNRREFGMNVYVKVIAERLDAPIQSVVFYHETRQSHAYGGSNLHNFQAEALNQVAPDYFQIFLPVRTENLNVDKYSTRTAHLGAFYVETTKGTRYWANPGTGGNFDFQLSTLESLGHIRANVALQEIPSTTTFALEGMGGYLNPGRCR